MDSTQVIGWMIVACVAFFAVLVLAKPLQVFIRFLIRTVTGLLLIFVCNIFLSPFGIAAGFNVLNAFLVGLLGIPGVVMLYVAGFLL